MLVLRALLGFSFVELLRQSLAHFQDSLIVLRALIEFSFVGLLRKYLLCAFRILSFDFSYYYRAQFQDPISLDFYVRISSVFRILIHSIVMLYFSISSTFRISFMRLLLLGFSFCRLLRQSLMHIQDLGKSVMKNLQSKEIVS